MKFLKIIKEKKFTLLSVLFFSYITLNLVDGERGLISYIDKQKKIQQLQHEKKLLIKHLDKIEKQNSLLTEKIDKDYLEIIYRQKFLVGKPNEEIYVK